MVVSVSITMQAQPLNLDDSTKNWLRSHLDAISIEHGNKLIERMAPKHVEKLMQQKAAKPAAANKRLKALKALFRWAIRVKLVSHNPTVGVEKVVYQTRGHPAWSMEEIATYRANHPVGKQARLAMELMFYAACRREDAVRGIANGSVASVYSDEQEAAAAAVFVRVQADTASTHLVFLHDRRLQLRFCVALVGGKHLKLLLWFTRRGSFGSALSESYLKI